MRTDRSSISLDDAVATATTGDLWLFRGRTGADRAIQTLTNSPVNHVGMAVVIDDLPPLLWHAELGTSLPDVWTGEYQRGVQLHMLADAVAVWREKYGQRAWLRQLDGGPLTRSHEDRLMEAIARYDGKAFPRTGALLRSWLRGRVVNTPSDKETTYCAELVAATFQDMGLLGRMRSADWYDPGAFWSGDGIELTPPYRLGGEIAVL